MSRTASWNDIPDEFLNAPRRASSSLRSGRSSQSPQPATASLQFRPGRAPPGLNQPRRKSSQVTRMPLAETTSFPKAQDQTSRDLTWVRPYLLEDGTAPSTYPLKHVAERVGREVEEFAEKLDKWKASLQEQGTDKRDATLSLVNDYKYIAGETVKRLRRAHGVAHKKSVRGAWKAKLEQYGFDQKNAPLDDEDMDEDVADPRDETTPQDLQRWQDELNTWTLFEALIENRTIDNDNTPEDMGTTLQLLPGDDRFAADGQLWTDFITTDKGAREKLLVLKWLELISEETGNDMDMVEDCLVEHGSTIWPSGWLETRVKLKAEKRMRMWDAPIDGTSAPDIRRTDGTLLVTQLDPDAVTRLERSIEATDEVSEKSLWFMCWLLFRRGASMDDIRDWFADCKHFDKAFAVGAHPQSNVPHLSTSTAARYNWRAACRAAAAHGRLHSFERAVVGLLAGNLETVQDVCQSWEDGVYAITNMALLTAYRKYQMQSDPALDSAWSKAVYGPSDGELANDNLVASLEHEATTKLTSAHSPMKLIQASMITDNFSQLAFEQGVEVAKRSRGSGLAAVVPTAPAKKFETQTSNYFLDDPDTLRVFAHVLIVQQQTGLKFASADAQTAAETVIAGYVNFLLNAGKVDIIPLYVSLMGEKQGPSIMARILATITNAEQRASFTKLMAAMGIDVLETLIQQYEIAMGASPYAQQDDRTVTRLVLIEATYDAQWPGYRIRPFVEAELRPDEENVIRAMEWFEYVEGCWAQTFEALKYTARRFLFAGRVQAAVELLHRMPPARVSRMKTASILGVSVDIMTYEGKDADEAMLCESLRAEAQAYYDMDVLFTAIQAMWNWRETEELQLSQNLSYDDVREIKTQLEEAMEALQGAMRPVLQQDILTTASIVGDTDEAELQEVRREELDGLEKLRQAYLPEMILAYLSALHAGGEWLTREVLLDALELSNRIAGSAELTQCFTATGRMRELLETFALCGKKLLLVNERKRRAKKAGHEKRLQRGRTFAIFESRPATST